MLTLALTPRAVQALASVESTMRALLLEVTRDISRPSLMTATLELAQVSKRLRNCRSIVERYARRTRQADRRSRQRLRDDSQRVG
jgi:hypothetical protein